MKRVFCSHCGSPTETPASPGSIISCSACRQRFMVPGPGSALPIPQQVDIQETGRRIRRYPMHVEPLGLARHLANHFGSKGYEYQEIEISPDEWLVQVRKGGFWRHAFFSNLATSIRIKASESCTTIEMGAGAWIMKGAALTLGALFVWVALPAVGAGMYLQAKFEKQLWQQVDAYFRTVALTEPS